MLHMFLYFLSLMAKCLLHFTNYIFIVETY